MIRSKLKLWNTLGAVAVSGIVGAPTASAEDEFAGGTLAHALEKIFEGEGGEGGLGFTRMQRAFSVPALTPSQLRQAFEGNTLSQKRRFAAHLQPDGTVEGWYNIDRAVAFERCPSPDVSGDNFYFHSDGKRCMQRSFQPFQNAKWSIKADQLCLPDVVDGKTGGTECYYAALVLNNVVLFGEDGKMRGKGRDLAAGNAVGAMPAN